MTNNLDTNNKPKYIPFHLRPVNFSLIQDMQKRNKDIIFTPAWLKQTYDERMALRNLMEQPGNEEVIDELNKKYVNYPVHPLNWKFEEMSELSKYYDEIERNRRPYEKMFASFHQDLDEIIKNTTNEELKSELLVKKDEFIKEKMKLRERFLANKNQTFKDILNKFSRNKLFWVGFIRGKKKKLPNRRMNVKDYIFDSKHRFYKPYKIFNRKIRKPYWFNKYIRANIFKYTPKRYGYNIARLHIRKSFTNIFLTLTDVNDKVIYTITSGMCSPVNNKRVKNNIEVLEKMLLNIKDKLNFIKVKNLEIIFKSKFKWHYKTVKAQLKNFGIRVISILDRRISPHNGVRAKKPSRK